MGITITITDPADMRPVDVQLLTSYLHQCAGLAVVETLGDDDRDEPFEPAPTPGIDTAIIFAGATNAGGTMVLINPPPVAGTVTPPPGASLPGAAFPAPTASLGLDSEGLPWDASIHSSKQTKIGNGTWKIKRGVDDATIATRKAQLRAAVGAPPVATAAPTAPAAPVAPITPPPPVATIVPPPPTTAPAAPAAPAAELPPNSFAAPIPGVTPVTAAVTPPPPVATTTAAPAAPAAPAGPVTFPEFVARLTAANMAGKITQDQIQAAVRAVGVALLPDMAHRPDLIPAVLASLAL